MVGLRQARMTPPLPSAHTIGRPRFALFVDQRPVVVLSGMAGYGKSTLLAEVTRHRQEHGVAIWLTLAWLIGFLYRLAPSRMLTRVELLPGAALAALGIVGLGYAFPLYTQLAAQLSTGSRFFTVVFGLVAWVYGIAQAVLIGAVVNRTRIVAREDARLALTAVAPAPVVATSPEAAGR